MKDLLYTDKNRNRHSIYYLVPNHRLNSTCQHLNRIIKEDGIKDFMSFQLTIWQRHIHSIGYYTNSSINTIYFIYRIILIKMRNKLIARWIFQLILSKCISKHKIQTTLPYINIIWVRLSWLGQDQTGTLTLVKCKAKIIRSFTQTIKSFLIDQSNFLTKLMVNLLRGKK